VPPSAWRLCSAERTGSRSSVGSTTAFVCEENPTKPTSSFLGALSRNDWAADCAAARRDGSTSVADIEPDSSVTSITEAFSTGTATVACGLAIATASTAAEPASSAGGRMRRMRGWPTRASTAAAGKRIA
jgi:hypothetical protein